MSQLWAIMLPSGAWVLRYTDGPDQHPRDHGCAAECEGHAVWPIARTPLAEYGESLDASTGAIVFAFAAVAEDIARRIKAVAAARIEAISPIWQQINDQRSPSPAGAARFAAIDAVRAWSNEQEAAAALCGTAEALRALIEQIEATGNGE